MKEVYVLLGFDDKALTNAISQLFAGEEVIHHCGKLDRKSSQMEGDAPIVLTLTGDPREALESLPAQLNHLGLSLARILSVLDAPALETRKELSPYVDFLAHFSDVMLLTGSVVAPITVSALRKSYKDRPMLIARLPEDLSKLSEILFPEARRLTQYFEPIDPAELAIDWGAEEDLSDEDDEKPVHHKKSQKPKTNLHKKKKTNVNQVDLEALEAPVSEAYFARDAVGGYKIKFPTP